MVDLLIRGGTVVDGTGGPGFLGDVRVAGGRIAEIGNDLTPNVGEELFDATGCIVSPGFIEPHTHYDAPMWWHSDLDPLPGYGATTIITGNCGFSAAPISDDKAARLELAKIFSYFEDIPVEPFLAHLPWDWRTWSEYRRSVEANVKVSANQAIMVGHVAIRLAAMGVEAWDRPATADERTQMTAMLEDAMAAGALGLSSNLSDQDRQGRPIPSMIADDAEWEALLDVLDRYPTSIIQIIIGRDSTGAKWNRMARLLKGRKIRFHPLCGLTDGSADAETVKGRIAQMRRDGIDIWPGYTHVPFTVVWSTSSLIFQILGDLAWHEVVQAEGEEAKATLLRDPNWRARARHSWDHDTIPASETRHPEKLLLEAIGSENGVGPFLSLKDYAKQLGVHPSDAMADWVLANGINSFISVVSEPRKDHQVIEMINDPRAIGNINDSGAHFQMLCGGGENMSYLTKYAREQKAISIEQAVHEITGKIADHFHLQDIGTLASGKRADVVVFNLDEIETRGLEKRFDMPDGKGGMTWRFTRPAAPMRLTLVNGVPTFRDGAYTGNSPGEVLSPAQKKTSLAAA